MMTDMTIGQYYPGRSLLHRMDPRMKLVLTLLFIVVVFLPRNWVGLGAAAVFLAVVIGLSRLPLKLMWRSIKPILILVLFTSLLNMFYVTGGTPLLDVGFIHITIALRFIPTLMEETDKIMSAQKARGADMDSGNLVQRVRALVPVLIPLFVSSFRRAYELAMAMECRCYQGGEGRTRMKQLRTAPRDWVALAVYVAVAGGIVWLNRYFPAVLT